VGDYFGDRAKDLGDVVGLDVYWGQGILAHGRATKFAQMGAGIFDGDILKYRRRAAGIVDEMRSEGGVPLYYYTAYDRAVRSGTEEFLRRHEDPHHLARLGKAQYSLTDPHDRGFYEVGIDAALFVGLGLSVDIFQTFDFVLGWFLIDLGRDDSWNEDREPVSGPRYYKPIKETPISGAAQEAG
jgi:hypothetical protein